MTAKTLTPAPPPETPTNPLREGSVTLGAAEPCSIVVFGATGDLSHRKLMPALLRLSAEQCIHPRTAIIGFARKEMSTQQFRDDLRASAGAGADAGEWERFAERLEYVTSVFEDAAGYQRLASLLGKLEKERGIPGNRLFYLATPPQEYEAILEQLGKAKLVHPPNSRPSWSRVIIEKPFGHDLASAQDLNRKIHAVFDETQIYRIDHYLGKESVQNILVLRLGNGIFEPLWNNRYVDHVQIAVAESVGVEGRAGYYESAGVSRDILQNHIMQLLTLTAMEPPARFEADSIRDEKVKVLRALRPMPAGDVATTTVRGQYKAGAVAGAPVPGYREEPGVDPKSMTETYLAARFEVDNWRWSGVPFFVRSGKRLPKRVTEIGIVFRQPPYAIFRSAGVGPLDANVLRLRIQPDDGISFTFGAKSPGQTLHIDPVRMDFYYLTAFGADPPEAYERLLLDCNRGDITLFARKDEVELAWEVVDAITGAWSRGSPPLTSYPAGAWGPEEADALVRRDGREWLRL